MFLLLVVLLHSNGIITPCDDKFIIGGFSMVNTGNKVDLQSGPMAYNNQIYY
jgi:hypothetical protein